MTTAERIERDIREEERSSARGAWGRRMVDALAPPETSGLLGPQESLISRAWQDPVARSEWLFNRYYEAGLQPCEYPPAIIQEEAFNSAPVEEIRGKTSLYLGLCRHETGQVVDDEIVTEQRKQNRILQAQTLEIAHRLERSGVKSFRCTPFDLWLFYVHSGHLEKIPSFRRTMILPSVAAAVRAPMLSAVESFLERFPLCRFWTFTSGPRVRLCEVRETLKAMHRRLSLLNAQPFMQSAGVSIVFRSSELGTPEMHESGGNRADAGAIERENGEVFFHVHSHTIIHQTKGYIPARRWENLIKQVWKFWGHHWDAGAAISNARECLKYVTKPGEMLKLDGPELAALAHQLRRMKLAQPMGILQDEIQARKNAGRRLIRVSTHDGKVYREVPDWNKQIKQTEEQKNIAAALKLDDKSGEAAVRIVARLLPAVGPAGVKEARMVVMACGLVDLVALRLHPAVAPVIEHTCDEFNAGVAIRVHTCTPTVLEAGLFQAAASWRPPPG